MPGPLFSIRPSLFPKLTASAKRAIFFATHGAIARGADEITPEDLLLGLARDPHHEECEFRFLYERREELAAAVSQPWPSFEAPWPQLRREDALPFSKKTKMVLRAATTEAKKTRQYWIDTDSLQMALLIDRGISATALQSIGYDIESTRKIGAEGRLRWPPQRPTIKQRLSVYPITVWILIGLVAGFLASNLYFLIRSR
jgi:ATP-dependent Clp protease ATP-binding subunit ClpA